ncbi:MAG TPA: reverse transcriptase domain-containing protein [Candidatus Sulfotelmatobacter sp.]|nr:reverse transcriptase domain-containing protein [Candidatus Sulfotelmatobacter sp.]
MSTKKHSALEQLNSTYNLLRAWKAISKRNERSHGLDKVSIEEFRENLHSHLSWIKEQLKDRSYKFTPARGWLAPKPGSPGRPIKIPAVRDRVVLKAIAQLIEHRFDDFNLPCSFGYVKQGGVKRAVAKVQALAKDGNGVVLEADIHKFFDEVNTALLFPRFLRRVGLPSLNALIQDALRVEVGNLDAFSDEERQLFPAADSGIPQGGVLSPMLANFYLYPFDKAMTDSGFNLVRYADDFVVMCKTEEEALAAYNLAKKVLEARLKLRIHTLGEKDSKTRIVEFSRGLKFLGVMFKGGTIAPAESVVNKFKQKIHDRLNPVHAMSLLETLVGLRNTINGWGQCYREFDVRQLYLDLDGYIRKEVSEYMHSNEFLLHRSTASRKQMRLLGIPELSSQL